MLKGYLDMDEHQEQNEMYKKIEIKEKVVGRKTWPMLDYKRNCSG